MKVIIGLLLLMFPFTEDGRGLLIKEDLVMLVINTNTTPEELANYKTRLKDEFKITLDYELTFDKSQKLKKINLNVDCNDGFKGTLKTTLKNDRQKVGFYRIFKEGYDTPFMVGNLPGIYDIK